VLASRRIRRLEAATIENLVAVDDFERILGHLNRP
jgi:hypothetical protein